MDEPVTRDIGADAVCGVSDHLKTYFSGPAKRVVGYFDITAHSPA